MVRDDARARAVRRLLSVAGLAFAIVTATLHCQAAWAAGAVAQGETRSGNTTYTSAVAVWNARSVGEARDAAMKSCQSASDKSLTCSVVTTFEGYCVAIAGTSSAAGAGTRMGWAIAEAAATAESRAMELCKGNGRGESSACRLNSPAACDLQPVGGKPWVDGKKEYPERGPDLPWGVIGAVGALGLVCWGAFAFLNQRYGRGNSGSVSHPRPAAGRQPLAGGQGAFPAGPAVSNMIALTSLSGGEPLALDTRLLSSDGVIVGRNSSCDVVMTDVKASGRHARFYLDNSGMLRVEDLKSSNGTWRNDQRVGNASIRPGDIVRIGGSSYRC